jgi:hypothetical protein
MTDRQSDFGEEALGKRTNLAVEFWGFLSENKKWWLLHIIVVFALVGTLLMLGGTAAAPFIYTLF